MAYDDAVAATLRRDLSALSGIEERRMFGALVFLRRGNMLCGALGEGAMFRVGKAAVAEALAVEGAAPMQMRGRRMGGMIETTADLARDDARRERLMRMALGFADSLPPK